MTTRIGIILGTPRQPSLGSHLFHYLQRTFPNTDKVTFTWLALRDYPLPFYDHEETPLETPIHDLSTPEQAWLDQLADATNSAHFAQRLQEAFADIAFYSQLLKAHPYSSAN
mgnify:CR=1 FL=1